MNSTQSKPATFTPLRFLLLLAVLVLISYPSVIAGLKSFYIRDFGYFGYPLAHYLRDSFWRGQMPFWNPMSSTGLPFLAQWNTMALYPGSLIYILLPLPYGLNLFVLLHLLLAGFAMFLLARRWSSSPFGGAVAGVVFAFNGLTLNCLMWPNNIAALAWMPLTILFCEQALVGSRHRMVPAILSASLQMLTGAPEIILMTWLVVGFVASGRAWTDRTNRLTMVTRLIFVVLWVAALAAAQLLPFFELLRHSDRSSGFESTVWSMPRWGWANFLLPLFGNYRSPAGVYFQAGQDWTSSYYTGIGCVALASYAVWRTRNRRVWLLVALLIASLLIALGNASGVYPLLRKLVPGINIIRFPIKFVVLAVYCLPMLAAFAVAKIETDSADGRETWRERRWIGICAAIAVITVACTLYGALVPLFHPTVAPWRHAGGRLVLLALIGMVVFMWLRSEGSINQRVLGVTLLTLLLLDLRTHAPDQNPTVKTDSLATGVVRQLSKMDPLPQPGESRAVLNKKAHDQIYGSMISDHDNDYLCHRLWLFGNVNLLDNIPLVDGFFSLYLKQQREVWSAVFHAPTNQPTSHLMDFLGVSQVSDEKHPFDWLSRKEFMPMVTGGQKPIFAEDPETLKAMLSDAFDPRREVYLASSDKLRVMTNTSVRVKVSIEQLQFSAHRIEFVAKTDQPALAVIAQSYYPNWRATVNGDSAVIHRANHAFQAVEIGKGENHIVLRYVDRPFQIGLAITIGALLLLVPLWIRGD